jgi:hypothetical protein
MLIAKIKIMLVAKIKIEAAGMLSNADIDRPLESIKLRAGFEKIERRPDRRGAHSGPGFLVIAAPYPVSETFAADGPSFSVAVRYEIGECDPDRSVKQLVTEHHLVEHVGRR